MRRVLTEEEKWRDLVGGFILTFGEIELFTYHLWPKYRPNKRAPNRFKPRTEDLIVAMRQAPDSNPRTIKSLEYALQLADKRNTIAHNPKMVEVYEHSQTGKLVVQTGIFSRTSKEFIDDAELTELLAEAEEIVSSLYHDHGPPHGE